MKARRGMPRHLDWTWLAVVPAALLLGGFLLLPMALGLAATFTSYDPFGTAVRLVGLANYRAVFADPSLRAAFGNALLLTALAVPIELSGGLTVALALRRPFPGRNLVRIGLLAPWLISPMAAGVLWHFLYNSQVGILGWATAWLRLPSASPLADLHWALPAVAAVEIWRMLPLAAFLFVPGVRAVPQDELDYATVLGCSAWTVLRAVMLPRLRVLLLTVLLLLIGTTLTALDSILVLTGGGPGSHTVTPALYSYSLLVDGHNWPQATAVAWLLLGLIMLVGVIYTAALRRQTRRWIGEGPSDGR
jgi:ABC-type sugar transport system permease subunit